MITKSEISKIDVKSILGKDSQKIYELMLKNIPQIQEGLKEVKSKTK